MNGPRVWVHTLDDTDDLGRAGQVGAAVEDKDEEVMTQGDRVMLSVSKYGKYVGAINDSVDINPYLFWGVIRESSTSNSHISGYSRI